MYCQCNDIGNLPLIRSIKNVIFISFILLCSAYNTAAQNVVVAKLTRNARRTVLNFKTDTLVFDTLSVVTGTVEVIPGIYTDSIKVHHAAATAIWIGNGKPVELVLRYRVLPFYWYKPVSRRDTLGLNSLKRADYNPFIAAYNEVEEDPVFSEGISRSGSISRGITVGNNQDLAVNSSLNLQLQGSLTEDIKIEASITDQNIPIQPDGNTRQLQDFDQVYIRFYNKSHSLTAGDFWIQGKKGSFMRYYKRGQGLHYSFAAPDSAGWTAEASAAISKGKFARNVIQGVEGNQGPYRLRGNQNEPFILVLAGTERIFIDGKQLTRGQDYDYIIDYNAAEIRFTPAWQITKDRRIVVEFQYSDKNYARSMVQAAASYHKKYITGWVQLFSEQDGKNQPLLQELDEDDKDVLANAGDLNPFNTGVDSVEFSNSRILYARIDTTVSGNNYTILVYNTHPDSAFYSVIFTDVGANNGNYIIQEYGPLGKIFKWVAPVGGVLAGNFEPVRILVAPNKNQMMTAGMTFDNRRSMLSAEIAVSNYDRNTFSSIDDGDNAGLAARMEGSYKLQKPKQAGSLKDTRIFMKSDWLHRNFREIERFRTVEFERDWNISAFSNVNQQVFAEAGIQHTVAKKYKAIGSSQAFILPGFFKGFRQNLTTAGKINGNSWDVRASALSTKDTLGNSLFVRHKSAISKQIKKISAGFRDEHEYNRKTFNTDSLLSGSYQFYDWEIWTAVGDTATARLSVYYRMRYEQRPNQSVLRRATLARQYGASVDVMKFKGHILKAMAGFRELKVLDTTLIGKLPDHSLTGRVDYNGRLAKGAVSWNSFYEVGSGLELKREFQYLEVLPGQGVYTWIDYNENGIKELNEFEVAAFSDQASYIRIFVPSDEYVQVFTNQFSQTLSLVPAAVWRNQKGIRKFLALFQNQASVRLDRKITNLSGVSLYNPFAVTIADTSLISVSSSARNSLFFNRTGTVFALEYTVQDLRSKMLLANGFDSRSAFTNRVLIRLNVGKKVTFKADGTLGSKTSEAGYVSGRDFILEYNDLTVEGSLQPGVAYRWSVNVRRSDKINVINAGGDRAIILKGGSEFRYMAAGKGSAEVTFNVYNIGFNGENNTPLAFEMLESLQPGVNYTWTAGIQKNVGKALQLTLNYTGRKNPDVKIIHSGGVQLRAFF